MGRRKIQILPIMDERNRNVTFAKRRNGLFKKANELGILCQIEVAVLVWSNAGRLHVFSNKGTAAHVLSKFTEQEHDEIELVGSKDFNEDGFVTCKPTVACTGPGPPAAPTAAVAAGTRSRGANGSNAPKWYKGSSSNKKRKRGSVDSDNDEDEEDEDEDDFLLDPVQDQQDAGGDDMTRRPSRESNKAEQQATDTIAVNDKNDVHSAHPSPALPPQTTSQSSASRISLDFDAAMSYVGQYDQHRNRGVAPFQLSNSPDGSPTGFSLPMPSLSFLDSPGLPDSNQSTPTGMLPSYPFFLDPSFHLAAAAAAGVPLSVLNASIAAATASATAALAASSASAQPVRYASSPAMQQRQNTPPAFNPMSAHLGTRDASQAHARSKSSPMDHQPPGGQFLLGVHASSTADTQAPCSSEGGKMTALQAAAWGFGVRPAHLSLETDASCPGGAPKAHGTGEQSLGRRSSDSAIMSKGNDSRTATLGLRDRLASGISDDEGPATEPAAGQRSITKTRERRAGAGPSAARTELEPESDLLAGAKLTHKPDMRISLDGVPSLASYLNSPAGDMGTLGGISGEQARAATQLSSKNPASFVGPAQGLFGGLEYNARLHATITQSDASTSPYAHVEAWQKNLGISQDKLFLLSNPLLGQGSSGVDASMPGFLAGRSNPPAAAAKMHLDSNNPFLQYAAGGPASALLTASPFASVAMAAATAVNKRSIGAAADSSASTRWDRERLASASSGNGGDASLVHTPIDTTRDFDEENMHQYTHMSSDHDMSATVGSMLLDGCHARDGGELSPFAFSCFDAISDLAKMEERGIEVDI